MANSTNNVETEKVDAKLVTEFCSNLRNGTSVLQAGFEKPSYAKNILTGNVPQGLGLYTLRQGQYAQGKKTTLFATMDQANKNDYAVRKGSTSIGSLAIRNVYGKDDASVKNGEAKVGDIRKGKDGKEGKPFLYINCFSADDILETKKVARRDQDGNPMHYEKDVLSETEKYKEDRIYYDMKDPTKISYSVKAGDPVILHKAGSIIMDREVTDKAIAPSIANNLPKFNSGELYPLPKPQNKELRETLKCELAEVFRGIYNGDSKGWNPSLETIDKIEKEFGAKPGVFSSIMAQADTYGRGFPEDCKKMEANINAKIAQKEQTNVNENVNSNHNSRKH